MFLSFNNIHLWFIHDFTWFIVHAFLSVNSILLYQSIPVWVSIHLLKNSLIGFTSANYEWSWHNDSCAAFCIDISFKIIWINTSTMISGLFDKIMLILKIYCVFSKVTIFIFKTIAENYYFSSVLQHFCFVLFFGHCCVKQYLIIYLISSFLVTNVIKHHFICLYDICIFFGEVVLQIFSFLNEVVFK